MKHKLREKYCDVFTGEDTNCALKGKRNVNPFKRLSSKLQCQYNEAFCKLGREWNTDESLIDHLEELTGLMKGIREYRASTK